MSRALSTLCLALFLMGLGASSALAKPSIAVLGLEVIDPTGTPTAQDTQVAKELTDGLRARAKAGTGTYQLAPGSDKELIDLKLLNNCDNEAATCMSAIGNQLGADVLLFGNVKKDAKNYQVTLRVLDVGKKTVQKSSSDLIPAAEASGAALQGWAKRIYAKLTGEASTGTIVVRVANADRGTILIDGEAKGNITAGSGQVAGLSEGKYKLTVESDGFRRWDRDVTVSAGQTATIPVELERGGGGAVIGGSGSGGVGVGGRDPGRGPEGGSGSGMWKGVFIGSLLVAAGGGGWWAYNYKNMRDVENEQCRNGFRGCSATMPTPGFDIDRSDTDGFAASRQTKIGGVVMGVGLGVAMFAFYKGFIAKSESSKETNASRQRGKRQRRDRFVVTPIVAPDGGGATVRLDW
jgi:hypothetical protein